MLTELRGFESKADPDWEAIDHRPDECPACEFARKRVSFPEGRTAVVFVESKTRSAIRRVVGAWHDGVLVLECVPVTANYARTEKARFLAGLS
jgi:hypothetical protein